MAAPFGFSVGDFIAAIELIAKVAEAVQDSGGAASQYQSLTRDLANLQAALLKVESLQNSNNSLIVGTVYDQTSLAQQSAQELLDGISKFEKKLGEQAKKGWKHGTGRKMQWAILQSKEVPKARSVIYEQVQNLSMLILLQILEMVQKLDESQQDMSRTITDKIDVSKHEVTNKITRLSTVQDAHDKTMINMLKSSLDEFHLSMRTASQSNTTQIKLLGDAIQDVQDKMTVSSNQFQDTVKQEGQSHRAELSRFLEGIDEMRKTILKQSKASTRGSQLATNDIKDTILSVAETTRESHAKLIQDVTQGLEAKITSNFESALAQFEKPKLQMIRQTKNFYEIGNKLDGKAVPEELLTPNSEEASITSGFFADCLAKILQVLYSALRRMQLSLNWFLPLVAGFLAHLAKNIPRQPPRLLENSIRFEDALGRVNLLPYEYFQYWEVFQSMLRCNFKGLPGESNVNAGLYFILRSRRPDQLITQKVWKRSVLPGANINMSILLAGINSSHGTCPRCKSRSTPRATTVKCQECDLEYHSSNMADLEKRQDEIAQRFLKLMGLGKTHDSSEPDGDTNGTLERSSDKAKSASHKISRDSHDNDSDTEPNTKTTQIRVKNNAQDIEVFKRIHTLIEEEEIAHPDRNSREKVWNTTSQEERERIKEFWLSLRTEEKTALIKVEKDAVLEKMREQQKHSCSCTVCARKRTSIEEELEVLYDAYYEELEGYASGQRGSGTSASKPGPQVPQQSSDETSDEEEYSTDEEEYNRNRVSNGNGNRTKTQPGEFFNFGNFGNSSTVKGGILTVADDLLKNDGRKFIEMMEQLAERRMVRESIADEEVKYVEDDYDSEESYDIQDEDYDEEEIDPMTEEQRMDEGRRMFQMFAARMFEQRVLVAYKEKVERERQQGSL